MKNIISITTIISLFLITNSKAQNLNNFSGNRSEKINLFASSEKIQHSAHSISSLKRMMDDTDGKGAYFGIRFMPTFTSLDFAKENNSEVSTSAVLGYGFGALVGVNFSTHVGLQLEIIYSSLAQKYTIAQFESKVKLRYINIPLLLSLNTGTTSPVNLNVVVGPQVGINIGSDIENDANGQGTDTINAKLAVKTGDIGFAYGAGLDFGVSDNVSISIGFRGVLGLIDISDNSTTTETDNYYVLEKTHVKTYAGYIGLSFGF